MKCRFLGKNSDTLEFSNVVYYIYMYGHVVLLVNRRTKQRRPSQRCYFGELESLVVA